jgi:hypothetical protein
MNVFWMILKYSVDESQKTHSFYIINTNRLMLFREIIAVYSKTHIKHLDLIQCLFDVKADGS